MPRNLTRFSREPTNFVVIFLNWKTADWKRTKKIVYKLTKFFFELLSCVKIVDMLKIAAEEQ